MGKYNLYFHEDINIVNIQSDESDAEVPENAVHLGEYQHPEGTPIRQSVDGKSLVSLVREFLAKNNLDDRTVRIHVDEGDGSGSQPIKDDLATSTQAEAVAVTAATPPAQLAADHSALGDANAQIVEPAPDESESVAITGLSVNPRALTLNEGDTATISTEVTPTNATDIQVTYESQDESVATVTDTGIVTAVKAGSTQVGAFAADGEVHDVCYVSVIAKPETIHPTETKQYADGSSATGNDLPDTSPVENNDQAETVDHVEGDEPQA